MQILCRTVLVFHIRAGYLHQTFKRHDQFLLFQHQVHFPRLLSHKTVNLMALLGMFFPLEICILQVIPPIVIPKKDPSMRLLILFEAEYLADRMAALNH